MYTIVARNVNGAWPQGLRLLRDAGVRRSSRNGPVIEAAGPVATQYEVPQERVLFDPYRNANPFFHLFEALWILAGRNDVEWPSQFCAKLKDYSDDGASFHGAYGHRLRTALGQDQLMRIVRLLREDPQSRRAVAAIWDARADLGHDGLDLPCNTHLYFKLRDNRLSLTVCNRSNDIVWGLYGANAVQWSIIQEYVAAQLGASMGELTTLSDSFHAYEANPTWKGVAGGAIPAMADPYVAGLASPYPLVDVPGRFDADLERFLADPTGDLDEMFPSRQGYRNSFFWAVAGPMHAAWRAHKAGNPEGALAALEQCRASDWSHAARGWVERCHAKREAAAIHG